MTKSDLEIVGKIFDSKNYGKFKVIKTDNERDKYGQKLYLCEFLETGFEIRKLKMAILKGEIKDYLKPSVSIVGCLGYASFKNNEKLYYTWKSMLNRCYNKNHLAYYRYGGKNITVCKRWHRFDYFLEDIIKIEGYDLDNIINENLQLDKDKKSKNNKIYSKQTCCFITRLENMQYTVKQKSVKGISPLNEEHIFNNQSQFSIKFNLLKGGISNVLSGRSKTHKGWKFEYINI